MVPSCQRESDSYPEVLSFLRDVLSHRNACKQGALLGQKLHLPLIQQRKCFSHEVSGEKGVEEKNNTENFISL